MIFILKSKNTNLSKMEYEAKYTPDKKTRRKRYISAFTLFAVTCSMFGGICSVASTDDTEISEAVIPTDNVMALDANDSATVSNLAKASTVLATVSTTNSTLLNDTDSESVVTEGNMILFASRATSVDEMLYTDYVNESETTSEELANYLDSKIQTYSITTLSSSSSNPENDEEGETSTSASTSTKSTKTSKNSDDSSEEEYVYFKDYIPVITLDYDWEQLELPYSYQKYLWKECQKYDNVDYYLMLGVMARESRFEADPTNYKGAPYYGFYGVGYDCAEEMSKWLGLDYTLDVHDPYDNITLGVAFTSYCIEKTGSEYAGLWAYGTGIQGYYDAVASGQTYSEDVEKAYKFMKLLKDKDRNPTKTVKIVKS